MNISLKSIDAKILNLKHLLELNCRLCPSIKTPPIGVCYQGISAVRKYYKDLKNGEGIEQTVVPAAVIGNKMAGKSSIIRSLQRGTRYLTYRSEKAEQDEGTVVFEMEDLSLGSSLLRMIDFGGHEVYHIIYQLTVKDRCIPIIVVNLEEYVELSIEREPKEATRRTCFDWLSHLYIPGPALGPPLLALTHADKVASDEIQFYKTQLCNTVERLREDMLAENANLSNTYALSEISHLANTDVPIFHPDDIFYFSNDLSADTNIEQLKERLARYCERFKVLVPKQWEEVGSFMEDQSMKSHILLSDVMDRFPDEDLPIILRYMHNTGNILWYEGMESLSNYIFHRIPVLTAFISTLFNHRDEELWSERMEKFKPFKSHLGQVVNKHKYLAMVDRFRSHGIIDETLLFHLIDANSDFPAAVGLELLKLFFIVHGPVQEAKTNSYIIPSSSSIYMANEWKHHGELELRADIKFWGLLLPNYVYQLVTVAVLNHNWSPLATAKVARNGTTITHGHTCTDLVLNPNGRNITLQVSTTPELLGPSWKRLLETVEYVLQNICQTWKATNPEVLFYCSHCLLHKLPDPDYHVNPDWFEIKHADATGDIIVCKNVFSGVEPVCCDRQEVTSSPRIPTPLRFPCKLCL